MSKEDEELDELEKLIPPLMSSAASVAYWQALAAGNSVYASENGAIYEIFPDGTRRFVKAIDSSVPVTAGATYHLK